MKSGAVVAVCVVVVAVCVASNASPRIASPTRYSAPFLLIASIVSLLTLLLADVAASGVIPVVSTESTGLIPPTIMLSNFSMSAFLLAIASIFSSLPVTLL